MKFFMYLLICLSFITTNIVGQVLHKVDFSKNNLGVTDCRGQDKNNYTRLQFESLRTTSETGNPELPVKYVNLIIPHDQQVSDIIIESIPGNTHTLKSQVYPVQPDIPTSINQKKPDFAKPSSEIYTSDKPYPSSLVKIVNDGYFDGSNHIVTLAVYPVQYEPVKGKLNIYKSVNFTLKTTPGSGNTVQVMFRKPENQVIYDNILQNMVDNPEDVSSYQVKAQNTLGKKPNSTNTVNYYDYVIITSSTLQSSFSKFIEWKKRKGIDIGVVTTSDIYANYSGDIISGINDNAGKIRQYLSDAYTQGTVWVLLGGDYSIVPVRYGCGGDVYGNNNTWVYDQGHPEDSKIPADIYFADLTGDWDVDGDIYYGEHTASDGDNPDYNPELFLGRLLCTSSTASQDISNWTDKVIRYELYPGEGDASYLTKAFFVAADQLTGYPSIMASSLPSGFTPNIFTEQPSGNAFAPTNYYGAEVIAEMNNLYGLYNWFCHGAPATITTKTQNYNENPRYGITTYDATTQLMSETGNGLDNLTNDKYPSILYSVGCQNAQFDDRDDPNNRTITEGFTVTTKFGGPATLANTRLGFVYSSSYLFKTFLDTIKRSGTEEKQQAYAHLGVAELISKQRYADHYLSYSHNLFGCPETRMWLAAPVPFASASVTDGTSYITVNAGVSGSTINVRSINSGNSYNLTVDNISSYTFSTSVRPLIITITKAGYLPYTAISGGTINCNASIWGKMDVLGNLTVSSGYTVTIDPGSILNFAPGISLTVNGTLSAVGTATSPITLTSKSGTTYNSWGSVIFSGSGASSSNLNYVTMKYGANIQALTNANVTIQNCTIQDFYQGVYIYNSAPIIRNNKITDPYGNGVYGEASGKSPLIQGNSIKKINTNLNAYQGVYLQNNTNPFITANDIRGFTFGIYCGGGGTGYLTDASYNTPVMNNRLTYNNIGLSSAWGHYLYAGIAETPTTGYLGSYNSIYSNNNYDATAYEDGILMAQVNWWGSDGAQVSAYNGGTIVSTYPKSSDPWSSVPLKSIAGANNNSDNLSSASIDDFSDIIEGIKFEAAGRIDEAINHYLQMINDGSYPAFALNSLLKIKNNNKKESITGYITNFATGKRSGGTIQNTSSLLLASIYLDDGKFDEAIKMYDDIIKNNKSGIFAINALFAKFYAVLHVKNDITLASSILKSLKAFDCSDKDFLLRVETADYVLNNTPLKASEYSESENASKIEKKSSDSFVLFGNYPNPFNPTTTISYSIPYVSSGELVIYDIVGREVRSFTITEQPAGRQSINWDGRNSSGETIASGIYLYRLKLKSLETNDAFEKTAKLIMLK